MLFHSSTMVTKQPIIQEQLLHLGVYMDTVKTTSWGFLSSLTKREEGTFSDSYPARRTGPGVSQNLLGFPSLGFPDNGPQKRVGARGWSRATGRSRIATITIKSSVFEHTLNVGTTVCSEQPPAVQLAFIVLLQN